MDYLDPKKQFQHKIILMVGYVLVGAAILIGTIVLVYQAYGFSFNRNGTVIQNGLFFFSSQPHPANIYVNGKLKSVRTNTRLSLPAGVYHVELQRDGYRDWQRTISLEGGSVEHVDYPFLIPDTLSPKKVETYAAASGLTTQSPDRRWLIIQHPGAFGSFDVYDLKNPAKAPIALTLPTSLLSAAGRSQSWKLVEWADDNRHVLLQHDYDGKTEFILVDRTDPTKAVNLDSALSLTTDKLTLRNKKYDQYYLYDSAKNKLLTVSLNATTPPEPYLTRVLAYQPYGNNTMLYVTAAGAPAGQVLVNLQAGSKTYAIRTLPAGGDYLVDLTEYSGTMYVAVSSSHVDKVYIYKDPAGQLADEPGRKPATAQVLHVPKPDYLSFSNSAQFIVAEHDRNFGVYDIENELAYNYKSPHPLDKPQAHASWMDGNRLTYVSRGQILIFDYDDSNRQLLVKADPRYLPAFTPDYKSMFELAPGTAKGQLDLNRTWLLIPADQ